MRDHVTVHVIDDEAPAGAWIHTHGLTKFGRPELELYDVPDALVVDATWAFHDFAAYLAGGALMRPGETLGDPARPMRVRHGGRDVDHWGSVPVLELVDLGPDQTPVDRGAPDGLEAWLRFEPGA